MELHLIPDSHNNTCGAVSCLCAWHGVVGWANLWLAASAGWPMTLATGLAGTWLSMGMADLHDQFVSDSNVPPIVFCAVLLC